MKNLNTKIAIYEGKDLIEGKAEIKNSRKKFKGSFDYSLDAIELAAISAKKTFYIKGRHQYTNDIICVKFKYAVKDDEGKVILGVKELRKKLYQEGFDITIEGKKEHFVRYKRTSGSARVGKCLFINEKHYKKMMKWSYMGLDPEKISDLAGLEAYISLATSSIIDTIKFDPRSILLIPEYESVFKEECMVTKIVNVKKDEEGKESGELSTRKEVTEIKNNIWDGQCLLDSSVFAENGYEDKAMLLLRARFFKGAAFNTNIQEFFKDNDITKIEQLNGKTMAKDIKNIKMICTESCIKYLKYGSFENFVKNVGKTWGIVKYDKTTHYFEGRKVQSHYQLINTLRMNRDEVEMFLKPSLDYLYLLKNDPAVMRKHLKLSERDGIGKINSTNSFILSMMQLNDKFLNTRMYKNFRKDVCDAYKKNLMKGHVYINGNYSTLFGNPVEMLLQAIGKFHGTGYMEIGKVHNDFYQDSEVLVGVRSPHVTMGNLLLTENKRYGMIDKYFNLTPQIVCINSIRENILNRLSGADMDSDTMLLTNDSMIVKKVKENYDRFLVPVSEVSSEKVSRENTAEQKADLDIKTSVNKIGEIVNLSQMLNTYYWDKLNSGSTFEELEELYSDICQLDVMSGVEIDSAKKEFIVSNSNELTRLRIKYKVSEDGTSVKPSFMKYTGNQKKNKHLKDTLDKYKYREYDAAMCYYESVLNEKFSKIKSKKCFKEVTFIDMFAEGAIDSKETNYAQAKYIKELVEEMSKNIKAIWAENDDEGISEDERKQIKQQRYFRALEIKEDVEQELREMKINSATIKKIIREYSKEFEGTELRGVGRYLLSTLYSSHRDEFIPIFDEQKENIEYLVEDKDGDVELFSIKFSKR